MNRRLFTLLFVFSTWISVQGRDQPIIDSLKRAIQSGVHDTSIAKAYLYWGEYAHANNPDTALILFNKVLEIVEDALLANPTPILKARLSSCQAQAVNNIGYIKMNLGNIAEGLEYYEKSLEIYRDNENIEGVALALNNIGFVYKNQGNIEKALKYYNQSLEIREGINDDHGTAYALNNIGRIYYEQGDIPNALEYYDKSLKLREKIGDDVGIAMSFNNIAIVYNYQGDIDRSLEFYHKSLKINEKINNKPGIARCLNNIGSTHEKQGDISKGLAYLLRSLKIRESINDKRGIAIAFNNIGSNLCKQDSVEEGIKYLMKALSIFTELEDKRWMAFTYDKIGVWTLENEDYSMAMHNGQKALLLANEIGTPEIIKRATHLLYRIYHLQKEDEKALEMYELFIQMRDSIRNEETQKATIRQQTKYEFETAQLVAQQAEQDKRRKTKEERQRRDNLQYSIILIALIIIGGLLVMIGRFSIPIKIAEGLIFFSFLIFFEFILVLADPYIDGWSGGAPGIKLIFNAGIAALIFPAHAFFEGRLKGRLLKVQVAPGKTT